MASNIRFSLKASTPQRNIEEQLKNLVIHSETLFNIAFAGSEKTFILGIFAKPHEVDKIKAKINFLGLNPNIENYFLDGKFTKRVTLGSSFNYKIFRSVLRKLEDNKLKYLILNE